MNTSKFRKVDFEVSFSLEYYLKQSEVYDINIPQIVFYSL